MQPTKDGIIRLVPDYTEIKLGNRSEWIRVQWKITRGFFNLHILVDLDTRLILAFSLTDMKDCDSAQLGIRGVIWRQVCAFLPV